MIKQRTKYVAEDVVVRRRQNAKSQEMKYTLTHSERGLYWLCEHDSGELEALPPGFTILFPSHVIGELPPFDAGTVITVTLPSTSIRKSTWASLVSHVRLLLCRFVACFRRS